MFKIQEMPNGNVLVFHKSTGELAMTISDNKENSTAEIVKKFGGRKWERSLLETTPNALYFSECNAYVKLPKVTSHKGYFEAYCESDMIPVSCFVKKQVYASPNIKELFLRLFDLQPWRELSVASSEQNKVAGIHRDPMSPSCDSEFSSQLGQILSGSTRDRTTSIACLTKQLLLPYEIHCARKRCLRVTGHYPVTYRSQDWHLPSCERKIAFNFDQKLERRRSLKYGLSTRSRRLLSQCRRCSVHLTRLIQAVTVGRVDKQGPVKLPTASVKHVGNGRERVDAVIDGTIVIQLNSAGDEPFTIMRKPGILPPLPSAGTSEGPRAAFSGSSLTTSTLIRPAKRSSVVAECTGDATPTNGGHFESPLGLEEWVKFSSECSSSVVGEVRRDVKPLASKTTSMLGSPCRVTLNHGTVGSHGSSSDVGKATNGEFDSVPRETALNGCAAATTSSSSSATFQLVWTHLKLSLSQYFAPLKRIGIGVRFAPLRNGSTPFAVCHRDSRCIFRCGNCGACEEYCRGAIDEICKHIRNCFSNLDKVSLVAHLDQFFKYGVIHVEAS